MHKKSLIVVVEGGDLSGVGVGAVGVEEGGSDQEV
jgi:hypothetical protein